MEKTIEQRVLKVLTEHVGVDASQVSLQASLPNDLDLDSLDAADLLLAVNEEFDTRIPPEALREIDTIQHLIDAVEAALQK